MISLSSATRDDLDFLFELRNLESNRVFFRNTSAVSWEEHVAWFARFCSNPENRIYVLKDENVRIGQFRVDSDGDVSVSLGENCKGKGYGHQIIKMGSDAYKKNIKNRVLTAEIKKENISSRKAFEKAGYVSEKENEEYFYLTY